MEDTGSPELVEHLNALVARMQTGVALTQQAEWERSGIHPVIARELKDLRVGVNNALCSHTALVDLLVKRGVFTFDEYIRHEIRFMEEEVERYTQLARRMYGNEKIMLGETGAI